MPKNSKPTAADVVYEYLGTNPGTHTLDDLTAALPSIKQPTLTKALTSLVKEGQIRGLDVDGATTWTADETDGTTTTDTHRQGTDSATDESSESGQHATAKTVPQAPDIRVMGIAFMLSSNTDGMTAGAIAEASNMASEEVWPVLVAMHDCGAATCDRDYILDPAGTWRLGKTPPTSVDLAAAPGAVECPTCGGAAPVPGRKATRKRASGGGVRDTSQYLPPGELARQVREWIARHPDTDVTPGGLGKVLREESGSTNPNSHSSGAVVKHLHKLVTEGKLREVPDAPQLTFRTPAETGS